MRSLLVPVSDDAGCEQAFALLTPSRRTFCLVPQGYRADREGTRRIGKEREGVDGRPGCAGRKGKVAP